MKLLPVIIGTIMMMNGILDYTTPCEAQNQILKQECETKAEKAAELIKKLGAQEAYKKIADREGQFVGTKSHVFCIDSDNGVLLAHKIARFVGFNMNNYMDSDQNSPYTNILEKAKKKENGWITYMTYGSGPDKRKTPGLKNMYFLKVPGENIVLCCGYWEDS